MSLEEFRIIIGLIAGILVYLSLMLTKTLWKHVKRLTLIMSIMLSIAYMLMYYYL